MSCELKAMPLIQSRYANGEFLVLEVVQSLVGEQETECYRVRDRHGAHDFQFAEDAARYYREVAAGVKTIFDAPAKTEADFEPVF